MYSESAVDQSKTPVGVEPTSCCFAGSRLTVWLRRYSRLSLRERTLTRLTRNASPASTFSQNDLSPPAPRARCTFAERKATISRNAVIRTLSTGVGIRVRSQANIPKISFQQTDSLLKQRFIENQKNTRRSCGQNFFH